MTPSEREQALAGEIIASEPILKWDEWVPVALVGPPIDGVFDVQFLIDQADESQAQAVGRLIKELDFYLVELGEENPWLYAQYHTTTMADAYSSIHWSFFPKRRAKRRR